MRSTQKRTIRQNEKNQTSNQSNSKKYKYVLKPKAASSRLNCQQYYNTRHLAARLFPYDFFKRGMGKIFINLPAIYSN
ncbi:hypothetical protein NEILACOT_03533 [Neisseria lactamica ATCC 23970]|uniref:Uncharacterized protein n=1 Tax=Neisseria lactamica ATCC 23970 TaxID=546265 RepID=D0W7N2_NEILA|nr:hypothetical protein NEILACOT_03533 [Neisseria lactamica ATCC 23970]